MPNRRPHDMIRDMKRLIFLLLASFIIFAGAGCSSSTSTIASNSTKKEPLVERRTEAPPSPPGNIPLPTPIQAGE